jgi:hypothetical protein
MILTAVTTPTTVVQVSSGGFGWDTIIAAMIAAIIAVGGYLWQHRSGRRGERAAIYGEAIRAVEDYLEAPYLILRKDGSPETRQSITRHISDVKSRISYYKALLELHAPQDVSGAYAEFVRAAEVEAGRQMTEAWHAPAITDDAQVPLGKGLDRTASDITRAAALSAMRDDLKNGRERRS